MAKISRQILQIEPFDSENLPADPATQKVGERSSTAVENLVHPNRVSTDLRIRAPSRLRVRSTLAGSGHFGCVRLHFSRSHLSRRHPVTRREPFPPAKNRGGEGLSTRGVVVLQERCVRCGVGSVPRQRHCNHGSSCDMVVRRRWRWIGARHATSPIAFLHLHQVARDFHFHLSSMLGRLPEPLTRYKTRDVGRRQALGRFADKTLDERLPSSRFRSLPGEF